MLNTNSSLKKFKKVDVNFTIPKPKSNTLLSSKKFKGGALMDMGPYAAAIARIFFNEKIDSYKINTTKGKDNLITSFTLLIKYKSGVYSGKFKFGGSYKNILTISNTVCYVSISRVFSPPTDQRLNLITKNRKNKITFKIKKDDCFGNFFDEVILNIKKKRFNFYIDRIKFDNNFRNKILKN